MVAAGQLRGHVQQSFALADVVHAFNVSYAGGVVGKLAKFIASDLTLLGNEFKKDVARLSMYNSMKNHSSYAHAVTKAEIERRVEKLIEFTGILLPKNRDFPNKTRGNSQNSQIIFPKVPKKRGNLK